MKIKHISFTLFLVLSFIWSANATTFSGHIKNIHSHEAQLKFRLLSGHLPLISDYHAIHLDKDGHFQIDVNIKEGRFAYLEFNNQRILIYLPAEGNVNLSANVTNLLDNVQFEGQASMENRFLMSHLQTSYDSLWLKVPQHLSSSSFGLVTWSDSQVKHAHGKLEQIRSKISEEAYEKLKEEVSYHYTNFILYLDFTGKLKVPLSIRDGLVDERIQAGYPFVFSPNASIFVELSLYTLEKRIKPDIEFFKKELGVLSKEEVIKIMQDPNIGNFISYKNTVSGSFLERALVNSLLYGTEHSAYEHLPQIHQYFEQGFPNSVFGAQIKERMKPAYATSGNKSKEIIFLPEDYSFTSLKEVFDYLNLKEEIVLVDIWGSWCKPCREEFKFIPVVKERLKGKSVAYLYIANQQNLSNPVDKWKKAVAMHNLSGYHIMINEQLLKELAVNEYPTYKIVNREGDVLVESAAPPSDTERMIEQLTSSLND